MYSIISINIGPILTFGTRPRILGWGRRRSGLGRWHAPGEAVEVDGVLRGRRRRRALSEAVEVEGKAIEQHRGRAP
jgi:hypothetical protein